MIGWVTDNDISKGVMSAIASCGHKISHINNFSVKNALYSDSIFYGILRGTGAAMKMCSAFGIEYTYLDNGYFGAEYIDKNGVKDMGGKYRICRNDMIEKFTGSVGTSPTKLGNLFLLIPPSPYTANFYDTTPEDWLQKWAGILSGKGYQVIIRGKGGDVPLADDLEKIRVSGAGVLAFNSMALMSALERNLPVYDTHGLFQNASVIEGDNFQPYVMYDFNEVKKFYESRQFTLDEIRQGKSCL